MLPFWLPILQRAFVHNTKFLFLFLFYHFWMAAYYFIEILDYQCLKSSLIESLLFAIINNAELNIFVPLVCGMSLHRLVRKPADSNDKQYR